MKTTNVIQAANGHEGVSDEALEMSIDEDSSVFLMDALGKLYSQPARAALREYLANGIDAHIEAGGKLPAIEISLPSSANRIMTIRDYGNGMSEDDFGKILRRYGASTKRNSNKLTGGFGLGAKAGFALSDCFHMTSYQSGKLTKVKVFKNASGKGFIEVVQRSNTNEPDGMLVEVEVPVGSLEEVSYNSLVADKFFSAYHDSEIIVTGVETSRNSYSWSSPNSPKRLPIEETSLHNTENYEPLEYGGAIVGWVSKKSVHRSTPIRAIIGRVNYVIKHDSSEAVRTYTYSSKTSYSDGFGAAMKQLNGFDREIILNLPIGSVDLPSSREEITYSERSLKTISAVATSVHRMVEESVQRLLHAKPTGFEALCEFVSLHTGGYWKASELTWRRKVAPLQNNASSFSEWSEIVRFYKSTESRNSLNVKAVTGFLPHETRSWADSKNRTIMIQAKDNDEFLLGSRKVKSTISDFQKADAGDGAPQKIQVFLFPPKDKLAEWFEQGERMTLEEFLLVTKKYRAEKRAEAKAIAASRSGNPAFSAPVKTTAATREVFYTPVNATITSGHALIVQATQELALLQNATETYYLSKAEVKDVSAELSNMFPTRQSSGATGYIDGSYVRLLTTLAQILGENAQIVFLPATRNMDEFKVTYPNVPSIVTVLKDKLKAEWAEIESGKKKDSYFSELFWLATNRNKVSLISQFFRALTPGEVTSMNADLQEINLYMNNDSRNPHSRLHVLSGELLGVQFPRTASAWMEKKIAKVGNRYPLLTMMSPVGQQWDALKPEMIRYLKTC